MVLREKFWGESDDMKIWFKDWTWSLPKQGKEKRIKGRHSTLNQPGKRPIYIPHFPEAEDISLTFHYLLAETSIRFIRYMPAFNHVPDTEWALKYLFHE